MSEWLIVGSCIGVLTVSIVGLWRVWSFDFTSVLTDFVDEVTQNQELQKKVYVIGVLLGNGIASGTGIKGKGGKFNLNDVIGQGIGMWIEQMLGGSATPQKQAEPSNKPVW